MVEAPKDDYFEEFLVGPPACEKRRPEQNPQRDRWQLVVDKGVLRRHHVRWRSSAFSPWEAPKLPVPMRHLTSERCATRVFKTGLTDHLADDWKELKPTRRSHGKWKGHTDFYLTRAAKAEVKKNPEKFEDQVTQQEYLIMSEPPGIYAVKKGLRRNCREGHSVGRLARVESGGRQGMVQDRVLRGRPGSFSGGERRGGGAIDLRRQARPHPGQSICEASETR